jgi:hypothetical protein
MYYLTVGSLVNASSKYKQAGWDVVNFDNQLHRLSGVSYFPASGPDEFAEERGVSSVVFEGHSDTCLHNT